MITEQQLAALCGSKRRAALYIAPLTEAMSRFGIDTTARAAAFLAQLMHESGRMLYTIELASGDAYEGRRDLGNLHKGDGRRFKGRGLIQITGRANYRDCTMALYGDERLLETPVLLEKPEGAALSAAWYWASRNLNTLADAGQFGLITRRINGGMNGIADRLAHYDKARELLEASHEPA